MQLNKHLIHIEPAYVLFIISENMFHLVSSSLKEKFWLKALEMCGLYLCVIICYIV